MAHRENPDDNPEIDNSVDDSAPPTSMLADVGVVPAPDIDLENLPAEVAFKKLDVEKRLADRQLKLQERRLDHMIEMENRIEDFKQAETLRLNQFMATAQSENWMKTYWRPVMGWIYALICLFDFVIAPSITLMVSAILKMDLPQWKSITLENGGMIHLAFAAILGVSAWTRGVEKIQLMKQAQSQNQSLNQSQM